MGANEAFILECFVGFLMAARTTLANSLKTVSFQHYLFQIII